MEKLTLTERTWEYKIITSETTCIICKIIKNITQDRYITSINLYGEGVDPKTNKYRKILIDNYRDTNDDFAQSFINMESKVNELILKNII